MDECDFGRWIRLARSLVVGTYVRVENSVFLLTRIIFVSGIASARCVNARRCARWCLLRMGTQF